jgi:hypothetical protein
MDPPPESVRFSIQSEMQSMKTTVLESGDQENEDTLRKYPCLCGI